MNMNIPRKRIGQEGFTLVELMIVVAIIGILAVLAIFGVTKYVQNAKTGEARNALGMLSKSAVGAYEQERAAAGILQPGAASGLVHQFCASNPSTVPAAFGTIVDRKYQSAIADWNTGGSALIGFQCLKFSLTEPQYFMYGYNALPAASYNAYASGYFANDAAIPTNAFSLGGQLVGSQVTVQPAMSEYTGAEPNKTAAPI